jgi:hypothetical protein
MKRARFLFAPVPSRCHDAASGGGGSWEPLGTGLGEGCMRRKIGFGLGGTVMVWLLSSCFMLNGFILLDYTLKPTQVTKARFTLRATSFESANPDGFRGAQYEFVLVGVTTDGGLVSQTARWGTTGTFGGPMTMASNGTLLTAVMSSGCGSNGLDVNEITGMTFKAYVTPQKIGDGNKFEQKAIVEVGIKAKADATPGNEWNVIGVAGQWWDDGDDTPESGPDIFFCHGIGTSRARIVAA